MLPKGKVTNFYSFIPSFSIHLAYTVGQDTKDAIMKKIYCLPSSLSLARDTDSHMHRVISHAVLETASAGGHITEWLSCGGVILQHENFHP